MSPSSLDGADLLQDAELAGRVPTLDDLVVHEAADLHAADFEGILGWLVTVEVSLMRSGERVGYGDVVPIGDKFLSSTCMSGKAERS